MSNPAATLLVVDDDEGIREMLARRLEGQGYTAYAASDGPQALALLAREPVELVLLDIMMPGMSGIDVLQKLREEHSPVELPVVMVTATAKANPEDVVNALEAGANDYVTKPIDFQVLMARVRAQLRTVQSSRSLLSASQDTPGAGEIGPGFLLADRYLLAGRLGAGSHGAVYKARHLDLDRDVAVKVLETRRPDDPETLARFRREGITACRVKHPNAVTVLDFMVASRPGLAFLVMELLEGHSLRLELRQNGPLTPRRCADLMVPTCHALAAAHEVGIVHRDVKPDNIFVHVGAKGEIPKVLDFGIATILGKTATDPVVTPDNVVIGTPAYLAPERMSTGAYDGQADVYSLGITLYEMLMGQLPFHSDSPDPVTMALMHVRQRPPPMRSRRPEISVSLEQVVMAALRKLPTERPRADELGEMLAHAVAAANR